MPFSKSSAIHAPNGTIRKWPKVTLYGDLNMRPFRNIWMLEEIGLPYKHVMCKPWSKVAKSVHPLGKVPALLVECDADDGTEDEKTEKFVVLESAAINTFLGDIANHIAEDTGRKAPALVPPPATPTRSKYDSLVLFAMTEIDAQSLWIHRKHSDLSNVFGEAPDAVREARRQFDNALDAMVGEIGGGESSASNDQSEGGYLLPTGFSAADIVFTNCCIWAQRVGWLERDRGVAATNDSAKNAAKDLPPKLESYLKQCRSRPAFTRANELRKKQVDGKKGRPINSKL